MSLTHKLGLGTAQWGQQYGVANRTGRPSEAQIAEMLSHAAAAGIFVLDTAHTYGDAERILGLYGVAAAGFKVITKTQPLRATRIDDRHLNALKSAFTESLERLRCDRVHGLLVHHADNLIVPGGERLWELMQSLKTDGCVDRVGVSVYHPRQLITVLERFPIDIVQVPFNVYDQRFRASSILRDLRASGTLVYARSPFLQGLLLMAPSELPRAFDDVRAHHARWLQSTNGSPLARALRFCLSQPDIDNVIVGCDLPAHVDELIAAATNANIELGGDLSQFALDSERVIDPSRWSI